MSISAAIRPNQGEQYSAFVYRAHNALLNRIPDPYRRNEAVWSAWESVHGDPVADQASQYFPPDKYRYVPKSVCYFREHTASKPGKKPRVYDFNELARIVDAANEKCDSDSYSAIASHHNPPPGTPKGPDYEPFIAGYMGAHRLGMIGRKKPIFAVFVDEYHDKQHAKMFDERRRRSVEVLHHIDGRPPFFDPVATLGSETPRLPLPVAQYQADPSEFESYSYVSDHDPELDQYSEFVQAGGSNAYIPGGATNRRDNYQSPTPEQRPMNNVNLSPDDIAAITQSVLQAPIMQMLSEAAPMLQQMMRQYQPGDSDPTQAQNPNMPQQGTQQQPVQPGQQYSANPQPQPRTMPYLSVPSVAGGSGANYSQQYSAKGDDDMTAEQYAALENELIETRERYSALEESHQNVVQINQKTVERLASLQKEVSQLRTRNSDADRTMVIRDLYSRFPHFVDEQEELDRCLYSHNSTMSDEEFQRHVADVEKYAKRSPVATAMVPNGSFAAVPQDHATEARVADMVVERYSISANSGVIRDYGEIEVEIRKELGLLK